MRTFENSNFKKWTTMTVDCFAHYKSSKCSRFNSKYLHLPLKVEDVFLRLAKRSMFKCLTPSALNKSGKTGILILPCWSLAKFGPLPFENQIKSIGIIMDVIYLTSTALGQRDFEGSFTGSKIWQTDSQFCCYIQK